ncbi:MAG: SDR family NAD(P)-dependent oxidoreductase [Myxococcota bacterium]|nr:SDR family NAD(P)-dependent oxidoreductase [Myxococcota bacterium]
MGRITVVTGASSGLGRALSKRLAHAGDRVVVMARSKDKLESLVDEIERAGGHADAYAVDVSNREHVAETFKQVAAQIGAIECLVANAGIGAPTKVRAFDASTVEHIIRINLLGATYCIEAVLPWMIEQRRGQIVGVSSLASYRGLAGSGAYCASKAGLSALLESLRLEARSYGITVTTICPGFVRTPLTDKNTFKMPFLMELEPAVELMYRAIAQQRSEYAFPWTLASIVRSGRFLPNFLYDRLMGKKTRIASRMPPN